MKQFLFSKEELELIKFLQTNIPKIIWFDVLEYIFDYEGFYISISIELGENISDFEQILFAKIKKTNSKFISQELSEILITNTKITEIYIVRTLIYPRPHSINNDFSSKLITVNSTKINPNLIDDEIKNGGNTFLTDVGIVLKIDNIFLNCFIYENDDDFLYINHVRQNANLLDENKDRYEFIKLI